MSEPRFNDLDERHDLECEGDGGGMLMCSCGPRQEHRVLTELHTLRAAVPAPITAEDVRAAETEWSSNIWRVFRHHDDPWAAFVADWLNRRGER